MNWNMGPYASTAPIWYVGPESNIYHTFVDCVHLNNPYRYWSLTTAPFPPKGRRLCKTCARRQGRNKDGLGAPRV